MKNIPKIVFFIFFLLYQQTVAPVLPQKIVICGVCKNIEKNVPMITKIIENIGTLFTDYRVIIYENNSTDLTAKKLQTWAKRNKRVSVKSEYLTDEYLNSCIVNKLGRNFSRPEIIAKARNIVQRQAMSPKYVDFPYILWIDMDFAVFPNLEGLIEIFTTNREWDAIFAYGITKHKDYWDWYATRSLEFPFGPELLGHDWYQNFKERERSIQLSQTSNWLPVYSAFGGCGIYKKSSVIDCWYSGLVTEDTEKIMHHLVDEGIANSHPQALLYQEKLKQTKEYIYIYIGYPSNQLDPQNSNAGIIINPLTNPIIWRMNTSMFKYPSICEHVPFHASMIIRGHDKLYINPRLIFVY